ncbi:MAG: ribonuclease PH [Actinomycetaceae bacterium]|nr:ribonuclease PH [Actinomycetaceae bacterium]
MTMIRKDGRHTDELRPITITPDWIEQGEGNVLIEYGNTRVLCVASLTPGVPRWRKDSGLGWVTGEYAMLPRATDTRSQRESTKGKVSGRTQEISRLIGRSLRACVDMSALGENTIVLDCDVLQADGGTRTAAITGAWVALAKAVSLGQKRGWIDPDKPGAPVIRDSLCAVSVGIVGGVAMLDLPYEEDVRADTDMNIVAMGSGDFIEIQGTAEHATFSRRELNDLLDLADKGIRKLTCIQRSIVEGEATTTSYHTDSHSACTHEESHCCTHGESHE